MTRRIPGVVVRSLLTTLSAAVVFAAGAMSMSPRALASVELIDFDVGQDNEILPMPETVPVSLDGTTDTTNTLPSIPESIEYDRLIRAQRDVGALDTGLLGESVDYYTGQTDFVTTDVSLPGSSAIPVAIGRRYHVTNRAGGVLRGAFGDWDIDIPHVEGVFATSVGWTVPGTHPDARCTNFSAPPAATATTAVGSSTVTTNVPAAEYSTGFTAVIPGYGRHELLLRANAVPTPNGTHPVTTKEMWAVSCVQLAGIPISQGSDEGFVVTTPDGITYTFNQAIIRPYAPLTRPADTTTAGVTATVDREQVWLVPTTIKDRFDNQVAFAYTSSTSGVVLKSMTASDGRKLTLTYNADHVTSITDGTRTWSYSYPYQQNRLTQVQLPDGATWQIDFADLDQAHWSYSSPTCTSLPTPTASFGSSVSGTIRHPTGASGTFTFQLTRHGRNGAPSTCLTNSANVAFAPTEPAVYDVLSLTKKAITGPNLPTTLNWTLAYAGCSNSSCSTTTTTTVNDARGFKTLYTFGAQYGVNGSGNEGLLLHKQSAGTGSTYLRDEQYTYYSASGHPYPSVMGTPAQVRGDVSELSSLRPIQLRTLVQDGATYKRTLSNPDAYGFSQTITRSGSSTVTETITYAHNTADWVLGTVKRVHSSGDDSGDDFELTFNSHNQPTQLKRFGRTDQTFDYYTDGTLRWVRDADGNQTSFNNYSLGIPKTITHADGGVETAVVSSLGLITSHKDVMGHTTSFGYDTVGRLKSITPPGGYNATSINWNTDYHGWTRTVTTGSATTTDTYDAFLHSVKTTDSLGRNVWRKFDADGNATFISQPGSSVDGVDYVYDGLDRLRSQTDNLGYTINTTYDANEVTVNDRNGNATSTKYLTYDEPSTAWPTSIHKAGISPYMTIQRDTWGRPTAFQRGGPQRLLHYNGYGQLDKMTEPETGTTLFTYYSNGTIKTIDHAGAVTETRTYDGAKRLTKVTYSDSSAPTTLSWRYDGQPDTATHGNTTRTYQYDGASLLSGESVTIAGTTYTLGYDYDANQHLSTLTYPDGSSVAYAPDAFGRPGKVGTYATGVTYYSNDAINAFSYGNGIAHSSTQDARDLPHTVVDVGVLNATIGYDHNENPTTITDSVNSAHARTLVYDDADRLHTASGPWGTSTFTYDDQNNLTTDAGAQGATLTIDSTNRPSSVVIGGNTQALTWDTRGRLTQKGSGASAWHYTFDAGDRLTSLQQGTQSWTYGYDALGLRSTSALFVSAVPATTIISVYDHGGRLLYDALTASDPIADRVFHDGFDPTAAPLTATRYIYLGNHLVAKARKSGATTQTLYVHTDALGTPIAQTDASKAIVGAATWLGYGGLYASSGTGSEIGPGYANQYADESGLLYMRARYYDPQLRRFISADPEPVDPQTQANFNRYAYASNSPFRFYDPSGREAACITLETSCVDGAGVVQDLQTVSDNVDALNAAVMASGPVGAEIGAAEEGTVAATEEAIAATPAVIDEVGQIASAAGEAMVRVGRWMSDSELGAMTASGRVQESTLGGVTSVSMPPNPAAWIRQTTAANYVEFDVVASAVRPLGSTNAKIYGPNSIFGSKLDITEMPLATNILQTACRIPLNCNQ